MASDVTTARVKVRGEHIDQVLRLWINRIPLKEMLAIAVEEARKGTKEVEKSAELYYIALLFAVADSAPKAIRHCVGAAGQRIAHEEKTIEGAGDPENQG